MEDYIVYRRVTEIQGTVIRAKSIEDANKKVLLYRQDDFDFICYIDDQKYLPQKTIRFKDAKEESRPDSLRVYKKRTGNLTAKT